MGISQSVHGTDNARALIALALLCGQVGRPGAGLHPLRGQNNVQGASDAGLIPMMLPDYHRTGDADDRARLEALWGAPLRRRARADGGGDPGGGGARRDPRHVHHGREPGDVGPRPRPMRATRSRGSITWWCRTSS